MKYDNGVSVYKVEPRPQVKKNNHPILVPKVAEPESRVPPHVLEEIVEAFMDVADKFSSMKYCIQWDTEGLRKDLMAWVRRGSLT